MLRKSYPTNTATKRTNNNSTNLLHVHKSVCHTVLCLGSNFNTLLTLTSNTYRPVQKYETINCRNFDYCHLIFLYCFFVLFVHQDFNSLLQMLLTFCVTLFYGHANKAYCCCTLKQLEPLTTVTTPSCKTQPDYEIVRWKYE